MPQHTQDNGLRLQYDREKVTAQIGASSLKVLPAPHQARSKDIQITESLRAAAITELNQRLATLSSLPVVQAINSCSSIRMQKFFLEQDHDFENGKLVKPIFFSPKYQQLVISQPDLDFYLQRYEATWQTNRQHVAEELENFAFSRLEFALHEYGHIIAFNKAIRSDFEQLDELRTKRIELENFIKQYPNPELALKRIPNVLSDLKAEVFRRDVETAGMERRTEIFAQYGIEDRVLPDGVFRAPIMNPDNILRMLAWYPVCPALGPKNYQRLVAVEIAKACKRYTPELLAFFVQAAQYFEQYYNARRYDQEKLLDVLSS